VQGCLRPGRRTPRPVARFTGNLGTAYPSRTGARDATLTSATCEWRAPRDPAYGLVFSWPGGRGARDRDQARRAAQARAHLSARSTRARSHGGRARHGASSISWPICATIARRSPAPRKTRSRISQSGRLIQTMLLRGCTWTRTASRSRRRFHSCRRGGKGGLDIASHADPAFSMLETTSIRRILSVCDHGGRASHERCGGLGARSARALRAVPKLFYVTTRRNTETAPRR